MTERPAWLAADASTHAHIPADPMARLGEAYVLHGNARSLPLADDSVDLIVTSPPYYALRSYRDGGEHYAGQIGSEATPAEYIDSLIAVTRECVRVLKPTGSLWVNLGDKYSQRVQARRSSHQPGIFPDKFEEFGDTWAERAAAGAVRMPYMNITESGRAVPEKSLMGLPWRYALRCIDELGLILRAEVVWGKANGLPESVTDRVRRSHEQWFHLTREPRYFSAVDEIRESYQVTTVDRNRYAHGAHTPGAYADVSRGVLRDARPAGHEGNPLGKLPGSVWTIPTEPLTVPDHIAHAHCCGGKARAGCEDGLAHYAAFPTEWPRRIILGWAPTAGVCTTCGEGRRPVALTDLGRKERDVPAYCGRGVLGPRHGQPGSTLGSRGPSATIAGYACACPDTTAPTRPAVTADPFGGTGTTAMVARALGATGVTLDASRDYCRIAEWRIRDSDGTYKARGITPPATRPSDGQLSLLGEEPA